MKSYYVKDLNERRLAILKSPTLKPLLENIIKDADKAIVSEQIAFKMSDYYLYFQTGNRSVFESSYFKRRRDCQRLMLAYWLTCDEKYLVPLTDYICYICDEFSWCLPAHSDLPQRLSKGTVEHVDLFQAETARLFGEIVMCVGDKLPEYILDRMSYEIHRRIFPSFEKGIYVNRYTPSIGISHEEYDWENCKMNWATVCGAGCAVAALYFCDYANKQKYINRFIGCLDSYLEGIEDDGCCQEGLSYWNYGFGQFVILAQAVRLFTDGKVDYFKKPKVREIALFLQKVRLSQSKVASFSDGAETFSFNPGLLCLLKSEYPEIEIPDMKYANYGGGIDSVAALLWFEESYISDGAFSSGISWFDKTQWYINRKGKYSFAAKGGYNDEPHNHNDIGSFMITVGEETFISDLGCGEYVKETFMPEYRYTFVQNSSRGHSVPIVNGKYQQEGKEFRAENVQASENGFSLDIQGAYPRGEIEKIHREFTLGDSSVILRDTFEFSEKTERITERIITKAKPEIKDGYVEFPCGRLKFDPKKLEVSVKEETFTAHDAVTLVTVYMTDFDFITPENKVFELEILI